MRLYRIGTAFLSAILLLASAGHASDEASPAVNSTPQVRAQYKNAVLGMTLSEWRALKFPEAPREDTITLGICSNMPRWTAASFPLLIDEVERSIGVVTCAYFSDTKIKALFISSTYTGRANLTIGKASQMDSVDYYFYKDELYRIIANAELDTVSDVLAGLTARFGAPTTNSSGTVQNKAGATFDKISAVWVVGPDTIVLNAPGAGTVNKLSVTFYKNSISSEISAQVEKINPAANKM